MLSQYIEDPAVWFDDGLRLLRAGQYYEAIEKFRYAADNDAAQPKYRYFQAFAEFQAGLVYQAQASVKVAAAAETQYPINGWGRMMTRYQGFTRLWLEKSRRYALAQLGAT
jgi:hypothetical protein